MSKSKLAIDRLALWDEINAYVIACGGDPSAATASNARMAAVSRVEQVAGSLCTPTEDVGRWIPLLNRTVHEISIHCAGTVYSWNCSCGKTARYLLSQRRTNRNAQAHVREARLNESVD
jgi:hypothetical protein